jgi:hypothetical protein
VRKSKQAVYAMAIAGVAVAACAVLITILANRDSSGVSGSTGPGTLLPDRGNTHLSAGSSAPSSAADAPPASGPHRTVPVTRDAATLTDDQLLTALELGNVVLAYDAARPPPALTQVQQDVGGAFDPKLAAAGQAVILDRRPGVKGVVALAWRRELRSSDVTALDAFANAWIGQGTASGQ